MNPQAADHRTNEPTPGAIRSGFGPLVLPEMPRPLALALKGSLAVLLVMFPVGMVLMLSGVLSNDTLWTTSVFLGVQFLVTFSYYVSVARAGPALVATVVLMTFAIAIEFVGVTTGYPFGPYYYSYFLEPFVIGNVPLAISFAWFALVVNSFLASLFLSGSLEKSPLNVAVAALLVLGIDLVLEPFAALVNRYWTWMDGPIPVTNFAAWAGLGLVFAFVLSRFTVLRIPMRSRVLAGVPLLVLGLNIVQFTAVNLVHGYWLLTACGLAVIAASLGISCRGAYRAR